MTRIGERYECWLCHGVFEKTVSDEEALAEMKATWLPTANDDDLGIVCDDCYAEVAAWAQLDHPEFLR